MPTLVCQALRPGPYPLGQHPGKGTSLQVGQHAEHQGHADAVTDGEAEELAFLTGIVGGGGSHGQGLGRDHLGGHATGGVGGHGQFGAHAHGQGGVLLHAAEQGAGGRVGTGQEHAQPAQQGREEGEQPAGVGEGQTQGGAHAGVVHQVSQAQDHGDGQDGEGQLLQGTHEAGDGLAVTVLGHEGHGHQTGQQDGGTASGQPVEGELGAVHGVSLHDGGGLHDFAIQAGPGDVEHGAGQAVEDGLEGAQAPEEHEHGQHQVRGPGAQHDGQRIALAFQVGGSFAFEAEDALGLPDLEQQHQGHDGRVIKVLVEPVVQRQADEHGRQAGNRDLQPHDDLVHAAITVAEALQAAHEAVRALLGEPRALREGYHAHGGRGQKSLRSTQGNL